MGIQIRKKWGCLLLTLALCMGLLPQTAWADDTTPHKYEGNLDIKSEIAKTPSVTSGGNLSSDGYIWSWNDTDKQLTITFKDLSINADSGKKESGDLILPDNSKITINLNGTNSIAGNIQVKQNSAGHFEMTIQGKGSLTIEEEIGQPCGDDDTLTICNNAIVTAGYLNIGGSACAQSYLVVNNAALTLTGGVNKQKSSIASIVVKKGIIDFQQGLIMKDLPNPLPVDKKVEDYFSIDNDSEIRIQINDNPTHKGRESAAYADGASQAMMELISSYLPGGSSAYVVKNYNGGGNYAIHTEEDEFDSDGTVTKAHDTPVTTMRLGKYYSINTEKCKVSVTPKGAEEKDIATTGTLEEAYALAGDTITLTANPPASGEQFSDWAFENKEGGASLDVMVTDNKFTMPANKILVSAHYKSIGADNTPIPPSGGSSGSHRTRWYDIEVLPAAHGSIEAPEQGYKNLAIHMTITPDDGYQMQEIIVTDAKGDTYKVRPQEDGTFQFTMPDKDVTVEVIFAETETAQSASDAQAEYILLTLNSAQAWLLNHWESLDAVPVIRDGRVMLPARCIIEALGGEVVWNADAQEVTILKDGKAMLIHIGAGYAIVDGEVISLDAPAFLENGRTYLPIRFIAENLGARVVWDAQSQTVTIYP